MDPMQDERFASVLNGPQFRRVPRRERKTKIDKRFQAMFKDKSFKIKHVVDKRGRPVRPYTSSEDLKKFYDVESSSGEEEQDKSDLKEEHVPGSEDEQEVKLKHLGEDVKCKDKIDNKESSESKTDKKVEEDADEESSDDAGDKQNESDTESTTDEESDDSEEDEFDHKWEELDADVPVAKDITRRLAVCNMDWDRIRAEDILAVFNSFKPEGGIIHSVKIYPSEYGLQRIEEEKLHGPKELVEQTIDGDDINDDSAKEGSRYHREKLRQYQINRLKYYYAVVECDSQETADSLYGQLNGMEYENSAVSLDIRFIPDDVTFDQEPKSEALNLPNPSEYKPRLFINTALQQVKVNLTWDETDPKRREMLQKAFREPETIEKDIKEYLASTSSSDSEDGDDVYSDDNSDVDHESKMKDRIANYRALLQSLEEKEKDEEEKFEMEITWESGMKEKTKELVKEKMKNSSLNPFEEKVEKIKGERKMKKKEKKLLSKENDEDSSEDDAISANGYSGKSKFRNRKEDDIDEKKTNELSLMIADSCNDDSDDEDKRRKRSKQRKQKKDNEKDNFQVDIADSRFSAIYTSHLYNIDPSDPHYKDTKAMQSIVQEKQKRKYKPVSTQSEENSKCPKLSAESRQLVNSVKRYAKFRSKNKRQ